MMRFDIWTIIGWIVVVAILLLAHNGEAMSPVPDHPTARERAARFAAQERYYEVVDRYGDVEGAVEAARMVYEMEVGS